MKRLVIMIISCVSLLLFGCPNPVMSPPEDFLPATSVKISLSLDGSMQIKSSIFPDSVETTVASFELSGTGPSGTTESWSGAEDIVVLEGIVPGDWTFTAEGKNNEGTVICSGSTNATLETGGVNNVTITLTLASGSGIVNISLSWPADTLDAPGTSTNLQNLLTSQDYPRSLSVSGNGASGSTGLIPSGAYLLTIVLTDLGTPVASPTRVVWAYPGVTTDAAISLSEDALKAAPEAPSNVSLDNVGATTIDISWTDNSDVTPLSALTSLTYLDLSDNQITSGVAELVTLTNADLISFAGNSGIPSDDLDTLENALPDTVIIRP